MKEDIEFPTDFNGNETNTLDVLSLIAFAHNLKEDFAISGMTNNKLAVSLVDYLGISKESAEEHIDLANEMKSVMETSTTLTIN